MEGAYINKKSPERFCDIETAENEVVRDSQKPFLWINNDLLKYALKSSHHIAELIKCYLKGFRAQDTPMAPTDTFVIGAIID